MIKVLRKICILLMVFVLGVFGTALLLNNETTDDRSDMNDCSLPELMIEVGSTTANRMYGYRQPMQVDFVRDSVTPIDTSKQIVLVVNPYNTEVRSLSYEIRTSDGSRVLENRKVKNLENKDGYLRTTINPESDLRMTQEYSLQIMLDTEVGEVYYYTRVISRSQLNTEYYLKFVNSFSEKCMDKTMAEDLVSYLEPETTGNPTNYSNINIHSSFSEISWGSLKPQISKKGIPVIKDINETTASISLEYEITTQDENGIKEIYNVSEFYRMRYNESRIRLLDFERSAQKVFYPSASMFTSEGLILGSREKDVEYAVNDDASIIAFVQQGELWSYAPAKEKIVRIFTFRKDENSDFRDSRTEHDIKIIRVAENGDVDFVLYGYMNRGMHEGYTGVCVYHYNNDQNVVEEKVFIPVKESFDFLRMDLGNLTYVNNENALFLLFAEQLYKINIEERSYTILESNILTSNFVVSDTNAHAAWLISEGDDAGKIKYISFDTGETKLLRPTEEHLLRVIGFMNEDLVYGFLQESDIITVGNGHEIEGIQTFRIEDFEGNIKKEYHQDKLYITNIVFSGSMMEFELSTKGKKSYKVQKKDNIMNNKKAIVNTINIEYVTYNRTGVMVRMDLGDGVNIKEPLVILAKMRNIQENEIFLNDKQTDTELYYVYAKGALDGIYVDPAKAVQRADEELGTVLNSAQQYVWERGNKKSKMIMNIEDVPEIILSGTRNKEKLQAGMGDQGTIIDLTGCSLDSVLYEVSAQRPVVAKTGGKTNVIIVGYDEYNTYLYDPKKGEVYPYGMNDSTELFQKAGNVFLSCIYK